MNSVANLYQQAVNNFKHNPESDTAYLSLVKLVSQFCADNEGMATVAIIQPQKVSSAEQALWDMLKGFDLEMRFIKRKDGTAYAILQYLTPSPIIEGVNTQESVLTVHHNNEDLERAA